MAVIAETIPESKLPDRYEVVNGEIVEVPAMGAYASEIANRIRDGLAEYGRRTGIGRPRMDVLYKLPLRNDQSRNRRPDVAFVSFDRWPEDRPMSYSGNPIDVVPELMVEVASPTDVADDIFAKALEYLDAGAKIVWVVVPRVRMCYIFDSEGAPRVIRAEGSLDGGTTFTDLSVPMTGLFPPMTIDEA
ncbi:MAG: Uma2 family endonuclease [Planctomycetia bacterium]|nr:Uma2 family endonuclease [Planctomycetia bacterium]